MISKIACYVIAMQFYNFSLQNNWFSECATQSCTLCYCECTNEVLKMENEVHSNHNSFSKIDGKVLQFAFKISIVEILDLKKNEW